MTRLPPPVRPLWPAAKVIHRATSRHLGRLNRRWPAGDSSRALPRRATLRSVDTVSLEPETSKLHVSAPGFVLRRDMPVGVPQGHWAFRRFLEWPVPPRFVLELRGGVVAGEHGAHITAGGVLDYETSEYFGIRSWEEHPLFLRRTLPRVTEVSGTVVSLAARGTARNYYHALMDMAARWGVVQEVFPGLEPDAVVVNLRQPFHRELVALLGLHRFRLLDATPTSAVRAERLLDPCLPNPGNLAPPWVTSFLHGALQPRRSAGLPERIYVTRGFRRNTRRVVDEQGLRTMLNSRGFHIFDPGAASLQEQIDQFAAARVVVAPHGAGLTNMVFSRDGVRLLELFAPTYVDPGYWSITSNIQGARYRYLVADRPRSPEPGSPMAGMNHDIRLSPSAVLAGLEELLAD